MTENQRTIIITADMHDVAGSITLDLGSLSPYIAASIMRAAVDDLERYEAVVTVVHEDEPLWGIAEVDED